jgi:hypothetical protein
LNVYWVNFFIHFFYFFIYPHTLSHLLIILLIPFLFGPDHELLSSNVVWTSHLAFDFYRFFFFSTIHDSAAAIKYFFYFTFFSSFSSYFFVFCFARSSQSCIMLNIYRVRHKIKNKIIHREAIMCSSQLPFLWSCPGRSIERQSNHEDLLLLAVLLISLVGEFLFWFFWRIFFQISFFENYQSSCKFHSQVTEYLVKLQNTWVSTKYLFKFKNTWVK